MSLSDEYLKEKKILKGDFLIKQNEISREVVYINSGLFRIFYLKDCVEVNNCFCFENSITSSFNSFIHQSPSSDSIQALEDSLILSLSFEGLNELYNKSAKWQEIGILLTENECLRLYNRTVVLSFETAKEKYNNLITHQPE